ncbi:MAG: hypothetical protein AB2535_20955 [Candidatus Thiodiazotropha endolucinida]
MGMDVFGTNGNYFRANIWQWRAICYAIHLSGYQVPEGWHINDGEGLETQEECNIMVEQLRQFLMKWNGDRLTYETQEMRVDDEGRFVDPGTPNSHSPYWVSREHLEEFIDFLKSCDGFAIH